MVPSRRAVAALFLLATLVLASVLFSPAVRAEVVVGSSISVGENPYGVAYDSAVGEVFVTNAGSNTVSVICDGSSSSCLLGTVAATVGVQDYPFGVAYDPAVGEVFVANVASSTVSVICDGSSSSCPTRDTVVANIPVGTNPYGVAYGNGEVFVANLASATVSVICDGSSSSCTTRNKVIATVSVGTYPYDLAYGNGEVFVTNSASNTVSVISTATNTVVKTITVGTEPYGVVYDSVTSEAFVTNVGNNNVSVISSGLAVVKKVLVGSTPYGVAYDSGKREVFVTDAGSNSVSVISDATNAVVAGPPLSSLTVGIYPFGAAYDSAMGEVFVTNAGSGTVSLLSDKPATVTTVNCPSSVNVGSSVSCVISITPTPGVTTPTGSVSFATSGTGAVSFSSTSCTLVSASCPITVTGTSVGSVTVTTTYSGDSNNAPSRGTASVTVAIGTTTTSVSCMPATITKGSTSTCTATVKDSTLVPTGTVSFSSSNSTAVSVQSSCTLSSGSCSVTATGSAIGSATITATYLGNSNYGTSSCTTTSSCVTVTVSSVGITLSPFQGPEGITVTVSGFGFTSTLSTFTFGNTTSTTLSLSTTACTYNLPQSEFTCTFTVPSTPPTGQASPYWGGVYTVFAEDSSSPPDSSSATFAITFPAIALSPTQNAAGSSVIVAGSGFTPNEVISSFTFNGAAFSPASSQTCTSQTTGASGASAGTFSCSFVVPSSPTGSYAVTATGKDGGLDFASATFTVVPPVVTTTTVTATTTSVSYSTSVSTTLSTATTTSTTTTFLTTSVTTTTGTSYTVSTITQICSGSSCNPTTLTVSCYSSSVAIGSTDTCQATVQSPGAPPTGSVLWSTSVVAGFPNGLVNAACVLGSYYYYYGYYSTCSVTFTPPLSTSTGTVVTITANYAGDALNLPSSPGTTTIYVGQKGTKTAVFCTPSSLVVDSSESCTVTLSGYVGTVSGETVTLSQIAGTGKVSFSSSGICILSGVSTVTCSLSSGSPSVTITAVVAGTVRLQAVYSGDTTNKGSSGTKTVSLMKFPTTTSASCSRSSLAVGSVITCSASVSGFSPTGTVTWTKASGSGRVAFSSKACALSSGSCSVTLTVTSSGSFKLKATYSGDYNNQRSLEFLVNKAWPAITPSLSSTAVAVGQSVTDAATLTGGFKAGGTVTYEYFYGNACTGTAFTVGFPVTVTNGGVPSSGPEIFSAVGTYSWIANYSGDSNNNNFVGPCQSLAVNKGVDSLSTVPSSPIVVVDTAATDSATLTGATSTAGGTVTYYLFYNSYCSGASAQFGGVKAVALGKPLSSDPQVFSTVGLYSLDAVYSGDPYNNAATSACEPLKVIGMPAVQISLSAAPSLQIPAGASVFASATLTGVTSTAGGTVTYEYFSDSSCTGTATTVGSPVRVTNGQVPNSASQQFPNAGSYSWNAVYSGDSSNAPATSVCVSLTVYVADPTAAPAMLSSSPASAGPLAAARVLNLAWQTHGARVRPGGFRLPTFSL